MADKEITWTEEQIDAITDQSSDILVSAAAGSGKTAVLTERLIRKITDPVNPIDISRILVVTFTEDAANELKIRIRKALTDAMAADPANKRLQRQHMLLPSAKISTIHGFCLDLIRSNYELLGLSPKLRVSDEGQNSLLMQQIADAVVDGYYAELPEYDDIDNFVEFADNFITLQDTSFTAKLISIYKKLQSYPEGVDFLAKSADAYNFPDDDISSSIWCQAVFSRFEQMLKYYLTIFTEAIEKLDEYPEISDKYTPAFESSVEGIIAIISAIKSGSYEEVQTVSANIKFEKMGYKKGYEDDDTLKFFKETRRAFSDEFRDFKKTYFSYSSDVLISTAKKTKEYVLNFHKLLSNFERRFSYEKRKRGIIDFNDMERMAYSLLVSRDGSFTPLASEIADKYDEVYIDEYQDVNSLQDGIFKSITRSTNRFMVGDIKQSIYGFRGAEPKIFADYRLCDDVRLIPLTHNFRSDKTVIDFSNEICGNLFTNFGKTVPYDESDKLFFAKKSEEKQDPEIIIIEDKSLKDDADEDNSEEDDNSSDAFKPEAKYVAKRISELVKQGVKPSDIAILMRSAKSDAKIYEDALSEYGIVSQNKEQKDLFSSAEVMLLMCILNVIDNPSRDIYLAGALKSPIYNITLSELAKIRRHKEDSSLYEALVAYTNDFKFKKGEFFLQKLEEYRQMANKPVDRLIWHIFCDSGLLAYASDNKISPHSGKANLMRVYEKARSFENGTFKGLYNFIRYVNDILDSDTVVPSPSAANSDDVVDIMTIHKSKGLERKYVFLCGTAKRFNTRDESESVIIEKNIGTSLKLSEDTGLATVDTFYRLASSIIVHNNTLEEEIRVLYVALTRAKSKLVIVASVHDADKLKEIARLKRYASVAGGYIYSKKLSFINWILLSENSVEPQFINVDDIDSREETAEENTAVNSEPYDEALVEKLTKEFLKRFSTVYSATEASKIPAKLSVSELYPTILDDFDDAEKLADSKKPKMRVPRFIDDNESRGARIGTATHQFMQFCDFNRLESDGVEAEIKRLTDLGFLDPKTASLVNVFSVKRFLKSQLFAELKKSPKVTRELRFNVLLNASAFSDKKKVELEEEKVLVQGVIDCLYETGDGKTVLLDYKTDFIPSDISEKDAEELLITSHCKQLSYYAEACKKILGIAVDKVIIYSFALGKSVEIPKDRLLKI